MKSLESIPKSRLNLIVYLIILIVLIPFLGSLAEIINQTIIKPDKLPQTDHFWPTVRMKRDVYLFLNEDVLKNDPILFHKVYRNVMLFKSLSGLIFTSLFILVLLQLKKLISSLSDKSFFSPDNIRCVRKISYFLMIWVWIDVIRYLCIPFFIPASAIKDSLNFWMINAFASDAIFLIISLLGTLNYGVLLSAFAFYIISIVFSEGSQLKEQSDLTI